MEKKDVKKAYSEAEKELKEKQIEKVKEIVKATLEKLQVLKDRKKELEEEIKILKLDLEDLKNGRLDVMEERQRKDKKAQETSVAKIVREIEHHHHHHDRWYEPYTVIYPTVPAPIWYSTTATSIDGTGDSLTMTSDNIDYTNTISINCSTAKNYAIGTYEVCGHIVNFR